MRPTHFHHDRRQIRRRVPRPEEKRKRRIDHKVDKLGAEEEHPERDLDRDESEENLEHAHELDRPLKALDLVRMLRHELGREDVGPELWGEDKRKMQTWVRQGSAIVRRVGRGGDEVINVVMGEARRAELTLSPLPKETLRSTLMETGGESEHQDDGIRTAETEAGTEVIDSRMRLVPLLRKVVERVMVDITSSLHTLSIRRHVRLMSARGRRAILEKRACGQARSRLHSCIVGLTWFIQSAPYFSLSIGIEKACPPQ
jgi:hypothetical protein